MTAIEPSHPCNSVVLAGTLATDPVRRSLPSGSSVLTLQVSVERDRGRADSVPVSLFDPPASLDSLEAGHGVVVVGRVARRFFRADGRTQSRTDVRAERIVPARHRRRVAAALRGHRQVIDRLGPD